MKKVHAKVWRYIVVASMGVSQVMNPILVLSDTQEQAASSEADQSSSEEDGSSSSDTSDDSSTKETESSSSASTDPSETSSQTNETVEDTSSTDTEDAAANDSTEDTPVKEETKETKSTTKSAGEEITDQLLEKGSLLTNSKEEFSQTEETRVLNNTPVKLKLDFEVADKNYPAGSTTTIDLPDHLGFSDNQGTISGMDASWKVDSSTHQLTITFNQAITDASFSLELNSYLYSETEPQVNITIDDRNQTTYPIDLYEEVDAIKYVQAKQVFGLDGIVYYNLDRNLSGTETLSLEMVDTPGASFKKIDTASLTVYSYDVDIKGNIIEDTKETLTEGADYVITSNEASATSVEINQMNKQKAYGVSYQFTLSLTEVSDYTYYYSKGYPTTGFGTVSLKQTTAKDRGISLVAKTSKDEKEVMTRSYSSIAGGSLLNGKGTYSLYIHQLPTEMKAGQQIVVSTENGQEIQVDQVRAATAFYEAVTVDEYFDLQQADGQLTITAKKDSNLILSGLYISVPFDQKDIILNVTTPVIADKSFKVVGDDYVQPISILNANNAETTWGNYYQNGAYMSDTQANIEGSKEQPVENLQIFVEHPSYLTMRKVREVNYYYKLDKDYVIEEVDGGTLVTFTTPITQSVQFDIGFNYVPDALSTTKRIPVDDIPVTITADGLEQVDGTVTTGRKQYSENTLQSKENKFLVNARQDTIDNLVVRTVIPETSDVLFKIYDVSNDQVDGIYPQYWYYTNQVYKEISATDEGYPTIAFDEENNQYVFDFLQTNKRYIIAFFNANGWQEVSSSIITGYTAEPLQNNAERGTSVTVSNTVNNILNIAQSQFTDAKNLTKVTLKTENIDSETKKVINPTITLKTLGNTNGEIDLNSIKVDSVPEDSYEIKEIDGEVQLIFDHYILEDNIEISYHVFSENAGQISASATIASDSMDTLSEARRTATSSVINLQFSSGDSDGVIYKTQASFEAFNTEDTAMKIPDVSFMIVNQLTGDVFEGVTDQSGTDQFSDIYTGNYMLYVSEIPEGYVIPDELANGMAVKLNRTDNTISFGLTPEKDLSTIEVKDSTLYVGDNWQAGDNFVSGTRKDGTPLVFTDVTVSGSVDTSKVGSYEVTYINGQASAVATIHVVENQTTVVAKDSTIYVGDKWSAADNFVSATDKDGNAVELKDLEVSGSVDTTTAGSYQVTYRNGEAEATATITVLADQTTVKAKDSTLYVGESWQAADNFVSATDRDGMNVSFTDVTVNGTVDTSKAGSYEVTYTNGQASAVATIHVVENQTTVVAKDSTIYVGDQWAAADNFVSATDKDGNAIELKHLEVSGSVDTTTAGSYQVTYRNGEAEATATITVLADQTTVKAKDSTLYVGESWQAADNFVSATDRDGVNVSFSDVTVSGSVDTSKTGSYEVTYTNGQASAIATIHVVENQTTVVAKNSTIYVGDEWSATDNFVSATDKDGNTVELKDLEVSGSVDTTTAGSYQVTYRNGEAKATATITVLADQTTVKAKDSTLYVGESWQAADNFVSATDKDGVNVSFSDVTVSGSVDTSKTGSYEVTYTYGQASAVATIHVVENQTTVVAKDSTIYVGDEWSATDNFVSATDKDGKAIELKDLDIDGSVDTTTAGSYQVTYRNGETEATATITVLADQKTVTVKDTVLYVGDSWTGKDNFVSATDRDGHQLEFDQIILNGSVDTKKVGTYQVDYSVILANSKESSSFFARLFGTNDQLAVTATATIKVIEKSNDQNEDNDQPNQHDDKNKPSDHSKTEKQIKATAKEQKRVLPKTGSTINQNYSLIGVSIVAIVGALFYRRKRNKDSK